MVFPFSKRNKGNQQHLDGATYTALNLAKGRLLFVIFIFMMGYLAIGLRLVDLTLIRGGDTEKTTPSQQSALSDDAMLRGTILDRNGELIATSLAMASVYADGKYVIDAKQASIDLAKILPQTNADDLFQKLSAKKRFTWLARNITPKQQYAINTLGHPGIGFKKESKRIYPTGRLTSHLVGYTDVDGRGISGLEKSYNKRLQEGGEDLRLSIDLRLQHLLHRELSASVKKFSAKGGVGIIMNVQNGEVLAMVSLPDFDPYHPMDAPDKARFNNATLGVFEMGSTFKIFSTAAALNSGKIKLSSKYDTKKPLKSGRFTINDYHGEKRILTIPEIFMHSSNIGTAKMAEDLGEEGLKSFYRELGFFDTVPMTFPERGKPLIPEKWRKVRLYTASYGHGVAVTPLHVIRATAGIVNNGIMHNPHLVLNDYMNIDKTKTVITAETSAHMRDLLSLVVEQGTARKAAVDGYSVGGKTGTANKSNGKKTYDKKALFSSFVGVFPMEKPEYAVLVALDEPQPLKETYGYATAGWTAVPVVAHVIEQMAPLYQISPNFTQEARLHNPLEKYVQAE